MKNAFTIVILFLAGPAALCCDLEFKTAKDLEPQVRLANETNSAQKHEVFSEYASAVVQFLKARSALCTHQFQGFDLSLFQIPEVNLVLKPMLDPLGSSLEQFSLRSGAALECLSSIDPLLTFPWDGRRPQTALLVDPQGSGFFFFTESAIFYRKIDIKVERTYSLKLYSDVDQSSYQFVTLQTAKDQRGLIYILRLSDTLEESASKVLTLGGDDTKMDSSVGLAELDRQLSLQLERRQIDFQLYVQNFEDYGCQTGVERNLRRARERISLYESKCHSAGPLLVIALGELKSALKLAATCGQVNQ